MFLNSDELPQVCYGQIDEPRQRFFSDKYQQQVENVSKGGERDDGSVQDSTLGVVSKYHKDSMDFIDNLVSRNLDNIHDFLLSTNRCYADLDQLADDAQAAQDARKAKARRGRRTVVLMDATYSMVDLIEGTKENLCDAFERAYQTVNKSLGVGVTFEMQMCAYRNYNAPAEELFESCAWEYSAPPLVQFTSTLTAKYGWHREAIEIAMHHVLEQHHRDPIGQVILLGDMPPNHSSDSAVDGDSTDEKRRDAYNGHGEAYWATTRYATPVHFDDMFNQVCAEGITVHAFSLKDDANAEFEQMAVRTGGMYARLDDLSKPDARRQILDAISFNMLMSYGKTHESGDKSVELAETYKHLFGYVLPTSN